MWKTPRMDLEREIELSLRSRFTLICIISLEEERVVHKLKALCERTQRHLLSWDLADAFQALTGSGNVPKAKDPITAAYRDALARPPSAVEHTAAKEFLAVQTRSHGDASKARDLALTDFCQILFGLNEFAYVH